MKKIIIIGAGNIGSRHLQGLKNLKFPTKIFVVDPNQNSLKIAQERYNSITNDSCKHEIIYTQSITNFDNLIDLAIIATNSKVRREVIEELFKFNKVKYLILEKILFQKEEDYYFIHDLLEKSGSKAWVNCARRSTPFYQEIKNRFYKKKINFIVSAVNWGLMSNIIHYVDYMSYILNSNKFEVDLTYLEPKIIQSKRKGFLELSGILQIRFTDGSHGIFNCKESGTIPGLTEIFSDEEHIIIRDAEKKAWLLAKDKKGGIWEEITIELTYQSQLTSKVAENIITDGSCSLVSYKESMKTHLTLYNPILDFLNSISEEKYSHFPFS